MVETHGRYRFVVADDETKVVPAYEPSTSEAIHWSKLKTQIYNPEYRDCLPICYPTIARRVTHPRRAHDVASVRRTTGRPDESRDDDDDG